MGFIPAPFWHNNIFVCSDREYTFATPAGDGAQTGINVISFV